MTKPLHANEWEFNGLLDNIWYMVDVVANIRNNSTGEIRTITESLPLEGADTTPNTWAWSDGNFSCDCNRHLFFTANAEDIPCSDGKYSVNLINPKNGVQFYTEFE